MVDIPLAAGCRFQLTVPAFPPQMMTRALLKVQVVIHPYLLYFGGMGVRFVALTSPSSAHRDLLPQSRMTEFAGAKPPRNLMESTITYDLAVSLSAPPGDVLESIRVRVTIEPPEGSVLIYGHTEPETITAVQVAGGVHELDLPFIRPDILIKYLNGLTSLKVDTLGFRSSR